MVLLHHNLYLDMEPEDPNKSGPQVGAIVAVVIVVLILLVGGWYVWSQSSTTPAPETQTGATGNSDTGSTNAPMSVTVTYTDTGFSPTSVTVSKGGTVTWVNQSGHAMWVASGIHPTHTVYDGTALSEHCAAGYTGPSPFDQCKPGDSYTFTFNESGTWQYHNHSGAEDQGTVIVAGQ